MTTTRRTFLQGGEVLVTVRGTLGGIAVAPVDIRGYNVSREVAVIPAMGFDYVPGDMIASVTAEGMGEVDEVTVAYGWFDFTPTRRTMTSSLEIMSDKAVEWRKLQWLPAERPFGAASFEFPEPIGRQRMVRYPAGEQITVPRHVATRPTGPCWSIPTGSPGRECSAGSTGSSR